MFLLTLALVSLASAAHRFGSTFSKTLNDRIWVDKLEYKVGDSSIVSLAAYADSWKTGEPRPAIVVLPDWSGLDDYEWRRLLLVVEEWGFVAIGADIIGGMRSVSVMAERVNISSGFLANNSSRFLERIDAAVSAAKTLPYVDATKIGVMGFCFGGACVLRPLPPPPPPPPPPRLCRRCGAKNSRVLARTRSRRAAPHTLTHTHAHAQARAR